MKEAIEIVKAAKLEHSNLVEELVSTDEYHRGYTNGLEFALSRLEGREKPNYVPRPKLVKHINDFDLEQLTELCEFHKTQRKEFDDRVGRYVSLLAKFEGQTERQYKIKSCIDNASRMREFHYMQSVTLEQFIVSGGAQ